MVLPTCSARRRLARAVRGAVPARSSDSRRAVVDLVTLDTLGVTSLVLTLAGFWAGRYGETTGRGRRLAPLWPSPRSLLAALLGFVLHYLLGEDVVARHVLVTGSCRTRPEPRARAAGPCARPRRPSRRRASRRPPRSRSLSDGPYQERRTPSGRFLPPDPRVREPYRLTPQLALRVGILGAVALVAVRGPVLPALVASGALGRRVSERGPEQPASPRANRGAARADPRPRRAEDRVRTCPERPSSSGSATCRARAATSWSGGSLAVLDVPPSALAREVDERTGTPLTRSPSRHRSPRSRCNYLSEHQAEFPGVEIVPRPPARLPLPVARAQILGHVGEISPEELKRRAARATRRRPDRQERDRGGLRRVPAREAGLAQIRVDSLGNQVSDLELRHEARRATPCG